MEVHLVVVRGNPRGQTLKFGAGDYLFGRGPECHVRPDSEWVSRQHCLLSIGESSLFLKDLGSMNGTLVGGQRLVGERELMHGDTIQVGPLVLQVRLPQRAADEQALQQTEAAIGDATVPTGELPPMDETSKLPSKHKSE